MRKFLISAAAAAAATLAVASPASAQYRGNDHRGGYDQRDDHRGHYGQRVNRQQMNQLLRDLDRAESRIQRGVQRGNISPREAQGLRREAANIRQRIHRASRNGLTHGEFAQLRQRINHLEQRVRIERRDRDNRRW